MQENYSITLERIIRDLELEEIYLPRPAGEIIITSPDVNRPGMELHGFCDYFDDRRINLFGISEMALFDRLEEDERRQAVGRFFALKPPTVIVARGLPIPDCMVEAAEQYGIPLLSSRDTTSNLMADLVRLLSVELAPRITRHGVLVEVYGEGVFLVGDSGVGKSETAVELIKRGHRLIADDAVEIRRTSRTTLVGQAPENIRYFIEMRGIGIVNARRIFGIGAVKPSEKIDMIINLEQWDSTKVYDRMGLDNEYTDILGINIPVMTIPVKPGRNLAIIIEVAAMNNRQKKMGYNAAQELLTSLGMDAEDIKSASIQKTLDF